jgi:hypothetical protein
MIDSTSSNPFCTRFFQPGTIPYCFPASFTLDRLVRVVIDSTHTRMAIVGPHGSGKSTLLVDLMNHPVLRGSGASLGHVRFQSGVSYRDRWRMLLPAVTSAMHAGNGLFFVDGWEQLDFLARWYCRVKASVKTSRLVVTSHSRPASFVAIWNTRVDSTVEEFVLRHMLAQRPELAPSLVMASDAWAYSRKTHGQNLRESLFDMYDWYRDRVDAGGEHG